MSDTHATRPAGAPQGIDGVAFAGPFPVGRYAGFLQARFRDIARVQLFGEIFNLRASRAKVFFELRDGDGAVPCAMWREAYERLGLTLADGAQVVVAGGPDFYAGSRTASPFFSFAVTDLRPAGEGDLLAQLEALRRRLATEGLFEPQSRLPRPALPRCIGVVTGEGGKARDDVLAGLRRRGWEGRLVWAFAPVQDRHAAPAITRALQDLAAAAEVEVVVVARGGGSLADLFAFCDETLCRTVALLRVPVIASVGHHTDRTLLDDVAAISCSTPTHAAEAAVPRHPGESRAALAAAVATLDRHARVTQTGAPRLAAAARVLRRHAAAADAQRATVAAAARVLRRHGGEAGAARARLARDAAALQRHGRRTVVERARHLAVLSRAPAHAIARHRTLLHQRLRELRAAGRRRVEDDRERVARRGLVLERKAQAAGGPDLGRRRAALDSLASALAAHDPERTVARGYAIVDDGRGAIVSSAADARAAGRVRLFFGDGPVAADIHDEEQPP